LAKKIKPEKSEAVSGSNVASDLWQSLFQQFRGPLFLEDVTEVVAALAELRQQGVTDFLTWLDANPDFISRSFGMVRILEVSDFAIEWAGAKSKAELGESLGKMVLPETLPSARALLDDLFHGRRSHIHESQYQALDGGIIYTLNQGLLPEPGDNPALYFLAATDITEFKTAQNDLYKSQERYSQLVEMAQDVILSHDLEGKITFINQAGLDMTGYTSHQILGQDVGMLLPAIGPEGTRRRSLTHLGDVGGRTLFEAQMVTRSGQEVQVEVNSTVVPNLEAEEGKPQLLALIRDISERKEAEYKKKELEEHLKHTQKMESLGALAGGIAHDFNNLLVTIMGNTELLLGRRNKPEDLRNGLGVIMEASTQAADLCRQMQTYAGKTEIFKSTEDLNTIVDNMSRLLTVTVSGRARLAFHLGTDLPGVDVDAGQIRQVIMHLVTNAADSLGKKGGEIEIRTGHKDFQAKDLRRGRHASLLYPGPYVFCEVQDSGKGMDREAVQRLFDPFYTTKAGSRGLGMSAALGLIQGHEGGFLVESQPGKGSTITFLLPAVEASSGMKPKARKSKKAPDQLHLKLTGRTVLSVDEDAAVRKVGDGFLRRLGCKVLSAASGYDAIRIFSDRHQEIDAVLLDLSMEGMGGVETCLRMRSIRPDLPVVFSSGFTAEETEKIAEEAKPFSFVPKPYRLVQIRAIMAEAIGGESFGD